MKIHRTFTTADVLRVAVFFLAIWFIYFVVPNWIASYADRHFWFYL